MGLHCYSRYGSRLSPHAVSNGGAAVSVIIQLRKNRQQLRRNSHNQTAAPWSRKTTAQTAHRRQRGRLGRARHTIVVCDLVAWETGTEPTDAQRRLRNRRNRLRRGWRLQRAAIARIGARDLAAADKVASRPRVGVDGAEDQVCTSDTRRARHRPRPPGDEHSRPAGCSRASPAPATVSRSHPRDRRCDRHPAARGPGPGSRAALSGWWAGSRSGQCSAARSPPARDGPDDCHRPDPRAR